LYVEPPVTLIGPLRKPQLRYRMLPKNPITTVSTGEKGLIRVLRPVTTLPFHHIKRFINRYNQRTLARQISQHVLGPAVLYSNLPASVDLLRWLVPIVTFYDCVDDHAAFGGLTRLSVIEQLEAEMAYASRSVFATADALMEKMSQYHSDVHLVPNAVELQHFAKAKTSPVHVDLLSLTGPRVGFIGGIGAWLDFPLIEHLANARKEVQFVFIGPIETDISSVRNLPNVHFLGRKPYAELPEFLAGFDLCLYPFANNKLTESVNPVKIYEYLAAGKEVLATPTREMAKFADFVWLIPDFEAATAALEAVLAGNGQGHAAQCVELLQNQTWQGRGLRIDEIIRSHLPVTL